MGVILWEVLVGRRLFRADTDGATLSRILVEPIPSILDAVPDFPAPVADAVATSLARNPADRYATAADMADAIENAVREAGDPEIFVASTRDVAAYMRELFGADIQLRRDAVRSWTVQFSDPGDGPRSRRAGALLGPASGADPSRASPTGSPPVSTSMVRAASTLTPSPAPVDSTSAKSASSPPTSERAAPESKAPESKAPVSTPPESKAPSSEAAAESKASPAEPEAAPAPASLKKRGKGPPLVLIAVTLLLVLAALATLVSRTMH
ncbi:MAG: hypothetical protein R3F14_33605 [Polyangiaceae bacterium]